MTDWSQRWDYFYLRFFPAWLIFIFTCTHIPRLTLPFPEAHSDKFAHFTAFAVMAFALWRFSEAIQKPASRHLYILCWVILTIIASIDEYTQQFFGRDSDWDDWFTDMSGLTLVIAGLEWLRRRAVRKPANSK